MLMASAEVGVEALTFCTRHGSARLSVCPGQGMIQSQ
jgi:hypothetical protein